MSKFAVGQQAWFESSVRYRDSGTVTIEKIGRAWISTDIGLRFDINTKRAEAHDGHSAGCLFASKDECDAEKDLAREWRKLQREVAAAQHFGLTIDKIKAARELLFG